MTIGSSEQMAGSSNIAVGATGGQGGSNASSSMPKLTDNMKRRLLCMKHRGRGVVYISHIPHGFYENEMNDFFKQFGTITNLLLARSKDTGKSKGYAYIEFMYAEIAKVVAGTMHNYLMNERLLKAKFIPSEDFNCLLFYKKHPTEKNFPRQENRKTNIQQHNKTVPLMGEAKAQKKREEQHESLMDKIGKEKPDFTFKVSCIGGNLQDGNQTAEEEENNSDDGETYPVGVFFNESDYGAAANINDSQLDYKQMLRENFDKFVDNEMEIERKLGGSGGRQTSMTVRVISCEEEEKRYFASLNLDEDELEGSTKVGKKRSKRKKKKRRDLKDFVCETKYVVPKRIHPISRYLKYSPRLSKSLLFCRQYPDLHVKGSTGYNILKTECLNKKALVLLRRMNIEGISELPYVKRKRRRKVPIVLSERCDKPKNLVVRLEKLPDSEISHYLPIEDDDTLNTAHLSSSEDLSAIESCNVHGVSTDIKVATKSDDGMVGESSAPVDNCSSDVKMPVLSEQAVSLKAEGLKSPQRYADIQEKEADVLEKSPDCHQTESNMLKTDDKIVGKPSWKFSDMALEKGVNFINEKGVIENFPAKQSFVTSQQKTVSLEILNVQDEILKLPETRSSALTTKEVLPSSQSFETLADKAHSPKKCLSKGISPRKLSLALDAEEILKNYPIEKSLKINSPRNNSNMCDEEIKSPVKESFVLLGQRADSPKSTFIAQAKETTPRKQSISVEKEKVMQHYSVEKSLEINSAKKYLNMDSTSLKSPVKESFIALGEKIDSPKKCINSKVEGIMSPRKSLLTFDRDEVKQNYPAEKSLDGSSPRKRINKNAETVKSPVKQSLTLLEKTESPKGIKSKGMPSPRKLSDTAEKEENYSRDRSPETINSSEKDLNNCSEAMKSPIKEPLGKNIDSTKKVSNSQTQDELSSAKQGEKAAKDAKQPFMSLAQRFKALDEQYREYLEKEKEQMLNEKLIDKNSTTSKIDGQKLESSQQQADGNRNRQTPVCNSTWKTIGDFTAGAPVVWIPVDIFKNMDEIISEELELAKKSSQATQQEDLNVPSTSQADSVNTTSLKTDIKNKCPETTNNCRVSSSDSVEPVPGCSKWGMDNEISEELVNAHNINRPNLPQKNVGNSERPSQSGLCEKYSAFSKGKANVTTGESTEPVSKIYRIRIPNSDKKSSTCPDITGQSSVKKQTIIDLRKSSEPVKIYTIKVPNSDKQSVTSPETCVLNSKKKQSATSSEVSKIIKTEKKHSSSSSDVTKMSNAKIIRIRIPNKDTVSPKFFVVNKPHQKTIILNKAVTKSTPDRSETDVKNESPRVTSNIARVTRSSESVNKGLTDTTDLSSKSVITDSPAEIKLMPSKSPFKNKLVPSTSLMNLPRLPSNVPVGKKLVYSKACGKIIPVPPKFSDKIISVSSKSTGTMKLIRLKPSTIPLKMNVTPSNSSDDTKSSDAVNIVSPKSPRATKLIKPSDVPVTRNSTPVNNSDNISPSKSRSPPCTVRVMSPKSPSSRELRRPSEVHLEINKAHSSSPEIVKPLSPKLTDTVKVVPLNLADENKQLKLVPLNSPEKKQLKLVPVKSPEKIKLHSSNSPVIINPTSPKSPGTVSVTNSPDKEKLLKLVPLDHINLESLNCFNDVQLSPKSSGTMKFIPLKSPGRMTLRPLKSPEKINTNLSDSVANINVTSPKSPGTLKLVPLKSPEKVRLSLKSPEKMKPESLSSSSNTQQSSSKSSHTVISPKSSDTIESPKSPGTIKLVPLKTPVKMKLLLSKSPDKMQLLKSPIKRKLSSPNMSSDDDDDIPLSHFQ